MATIEQHRKVQDMARQAMAATNDLLRPGFTLSEVRQRCEEHLLKLGADGFWYWGIGAFIFAGDGTVASISGSEYRTPDYVLGEDEIITIDLSPKKNGVWGDYARTLILEDGKPVHNPKEASNLEWRNGISVEERLHAQFREVAAPSKTFHEIAYEMNEVIERLGYENLDFRGNLGHSIEFDMSNRVYIEPGNHERLDSVELVTFEPHIRRLNGTFGYKHENIYYFRDLDLQPL